MEIQNTPLGIGLRYLWAVFALFAILGFSILSSVIRADRGGFSPTQDYVTESGQKAIIAWNGTHEILLLSTDVASNEESEVVEIMPVPSNPTMSKGETQSFLKVIELVNTYLNATTSRRRNLYLRNEWMKSSESSAPQVTITFQEMIGVHNLTVVRVESAEALSQWLEDFLETKGYSRELPENAQELFEYYIRNGMNFFVIDVIQTDSAVKTVDPIIYKFNSSKLYYPLRISTLFSGDTDISLFTITSNQLNDNSVSEAGFAKKAQFYVKQTTLAEIGTNITRLFSSDPCICYFEFSGSMESFSNDILADFQSSLNTSEIVLASAGVCSVFIFLGLFLRLNNTGLRLQNTRIPTVRRLEIASIFAGLIGISLVLASLFLPLGLVRFGENAEVLIAISGAYLPSLTSNAVIDFVFFIFLSVVICCYIYQLIQRNSKAASSILVAGGTYMILNVLALYAYFYTMDIGFYTILIGCSSVILAGLLSLWRIRRISTDTTIVMANTTLKAYIARRVIIFLVNLIGVSFFIFLFLFLY